MDILWTTACLSFLTKKMQQPGPRGRCLLVFSEELGPHCCVTHTRGIYSLVFPAGKRQAAWARRTRMASACLSFLSKKSVGPLGSSLVFSRGEDKLGPGKTWACLSFLSKRAEPPGRKPTCFSDRRGRKDCLLVFSI